MTDLSGKSLANVTKTATDTAPPRFTSARIYDTDGNGKVDRITVSASEPLGVNTNTGSWNINSPLAGVSLSSVSVVGSTILLNIAEPTTANTSTGGMTLSFSNNGSWKDGANNLVSAVTNLSLTDTAIPVSTQVRTFDNGGFYAIDFTFSEAITGTLSGFTLSGTSTYTGAILHPAPDTLRLITADSTMSDTAKTYSLSYSGSGIYLKDGNDNHLADFSNASVTDAIAPKILTRTTLDSDGNGKIDGIRFGFSETLS